MPKLKNLRMQALLMKELLVSEKEATKLARQLTEEQREQLAFSLKDQKELFLEIIYRLMINTHRTYSQAVKKLIQTLDKNPEHYALKKWQVEILFAGRKALEKQLDELIMQEAYTKVDRAGVQQAYIKERLNAIEIMPLLTNTLKFPKEEAKKLYYELAKYSERILQLPGIIKNQLHDFFTVLDELRKQGISPEEAQADILDIIDNKPSRFSHLPGHVEKVQNLGFRKWYIESLVSEAMKAEIMKNKLGQLATDEPDKTKIKELSKDLRHCVNEQKLKLYEETLLEMFLDQGKPESPEVLKFKHDLETSIVEDFIDLQSGGKFAVDLFMQDQSSKNPSTAEHQEPELFRINSPQNHSLAQALQGPIRSLYTTFVSSLQNCTAAFPQTLASNPNNTSVQAADSQSIPAKERNTYARLMDSIMLGDGYPSYSEAVKKLIRLLQNSHDPYDLKIWQVELLAKDSGLETEVTAGVQEMRAQQQDRMGVQQCALHYQLEDEKNKAQFPNKKLVQESIETLWTPIANSLASDFDPFRYRLFDELLQKSILAAATQNYEPEKLEFLNLFYEELKKSILIDTLYYYNNAGPNVDFLQGDSGSKLLYGYPPQVLPLSFPEELFEKRLATAGSELTGMYTQFIEELKKAREKMPRNTSAWKVLEEQLNKNNSAAAPIPVLKTTALLPASNFRPAYASIQAPGPEKQTAFVNFTDEALSPTFIARLPSTLFSVQESGPVIPLVASIAVLATLAYHLSKPIRRPFSHFFSKPETRPDTLEPSVNQANTPRRFQIRG